MLTMDELKEIVFSRQDELRRFKIAEKIKTYLYVYGKI